MFKVKKKTTKTRCEICSELTIKTAKRRYFRLSGVLIVNFEHILHLVLVFSVLILNRKCRLASVVFTSIFAEAVTQRCFSRKVFYEYLISLQQNIIHAKVWLQLYWNRTSAWISLCKYAAYQQQNAFFRGHIEGAASVHRSKDRGSKCRGKKYIKTFWNTFRYYKHLV